MTTSKRIMRAQAEDVAQDVFAVLMRDGVDLPPGPLLCARVVRRVFKYAAGSVHEDRSLVRERR